MAEIALKLTLDPVLDVAKINVLIASLKKSLGPLGDAIKPIDADKLNKELGKVAFEAEKARKKIEEIEEAAKKAARGGDAFGKAFKFNQITQAVTTVATSFQAVLSVGNEFESTLAAVGAVTGQSGDRKSVV